MVWTFQVVGSEQRRFFARIIQVLDNQQVTVHSFSGLVNDETCIVTATVESRDDRRHRIEALLYRLEGVQNVWLTTESTEQVS